MKNGFVKRLYLYCLCPIVFFALMGCTEQPRESVVTIVNIGSNDRIKLGRMIRAVKMYDPKLIALDFFLVPDSADVDTVLVKELASIDNTVQIVGLHARDEDSDVPDSVEMNHPKFKTADYGYANLWGNDRYYIEKHLPLKQTVESQEYYAFSYVIAKNAFGVKNKFSDPDEAFVEFDMQGLGKNYKRIEHDDLLGGKVNRADIEGRIVLLGYLDDNEDIVWIKGENGRYNGVEVHAAMIDELIDRLRD